MNINCKNLFSTFILLSLVSTNTRAQESYGKYYTNTNTDDFLSDKSLNMTINPAKFDFSLLHAALFHLCNKEREDYSKTQYIYMNDLEKSANIHSEEMTEHHFFSHTNEKNNKYKTPADRIFYFNKDYKTVGENIVANNLMEYEGSILKYSIRQIGDKEVYIGSNDKELEYTTYFNLAKRLTQQWMDSPPHKKNMLSNDFTLLGCACALEEADDFMKIKCTQNFGALFH